MTDGLTREWLVTNGLGGYASSTVMGALTRRYHGLLIAALPNPFGRTVMLNRLIERFTLPDGQRIEVSGEQPVEDDLEVPSGEHLVEFGLEMGLPVWRYDIAGSLVEKRVLMPHMQNTVHITYRRLSGEGALRLDLRPSLHVRPHEAPVSAELGSMPYQVTALGNRFEISPRADLPPLRLRLFGKNAVFALDGGITRDIFYPLEARRGYEAHSLLWSPGSFGVDLLPHGEATFVASTESWSTILALSPAEIRRAEHERRERLVAAAHPAAHASPGSDLVLAADQFVILPVSRAEQARAHAFGDEVRSIIAGYHWFTDWGRDTMISLEGLTLTTGRANEAGYILRTFSHYVRDGLIPNYFPEGQEEGVYHTADATLWFFHALDRYVEVTGDRATLRIILPILRDIVDHHLRGTRFGIRVDPRDGLLCQGAEGYQLTWMDAKVEGWVVTPRRGKAVEINALWYNALCLLARWLREEGAADDARAMEEHAKRARASFNQRFWYERGGYLYDVVDGEDGDDPSCRPNQVFAISLPNAVLDSERWEPVMQVVRERLLTPVGLRSLAPGHPDYKPQYFGDLRSRDAAYHQGTVWGWLIGPYVDAQLKLHPEDRAGARAILDGLVAHLQTACVGQISEVFDAERPHIPRGCVAQAWSVAEALRCWVKTAD